MRDPVERLRSDRDPFLDTSLVRVSAGVVRPASQPWLHQSGDSRGSGGDVNGMEPWSRGRHVVWLSYLYVIPSIEITCVCASLATRHSYSASTNESDRSYYPPFLGCRACYCYESCHCSETITIWSELGDRSSPPRCSKPMPAPRLCTSISTIIVTYASASSASSSTVTALPFPLFRASGSELCAADCRPFAEPHPAAGCGTLASP